MIVFTAFAVSVAMLPAQHQLRPMRNDVSGSKAFMPWSEVIAYTFT
jgi:hypothetical protein